MFIIMAGLTFQFVDYYLPGDFYRYDWIENLGIDLGVNVEQVAFSGMQAQADTNKISQKSKSERISAYCRQEERQRQVRRRL